MSDTICAIATPPGCGGIGIVRISGTHAYECAKRCFRPMPKRAREMSFGQVYDGGNALDEAMCVYFPAPASYTREDVCEIHCHGGMQPLRVMELILKHGARAARPGEFTMRAFLNGRIDLAQAEAVMELIAAGGAADAGASMRRLSGGLSRYIANAKAELTAALSGIAAALDFPEEMEEDLPRILSDLFGRFSKLLQGIEANIAKDNGKILREGLHVAICGAPNVGKSSLLNALLDEDLAIVATVPGTTRDVLTGTIELDGYQIKLYDTAGLRETDDEIEKIGAERAINAARGADALLIVVDDRLEIPAGIVFNDKPCALVMNKWDLGEYPAPEGEFRRVHVSCSSGEGLDDVRGILRDFAITGGGQELFVTPRHAELAKIAAAALSDACDALNAGLPLDIVAIDAQAALTALCTVTGENATDELIDKVFANFCVGK